MVDPAFLCGRRAYERTLHNAKVKFDAPYLLAYILTPSEEKKTALLYLAKHLNIDLKVVVDRQSDQAESMRQLGLAEYALEANQIEDWLYSIKHAEYVVTDSFHGTLFSILFNKQFASINNPRRGATRFTSLLSSLEIENRLLPEGSNGAAIMRVLTQPIDYDAVQVLLDKQVDEAKEWLEDALHQPLPEPTGYDFQLKEKNALYRQLNTLRDEKREADKTIQALRQQVDEIKAKKEEAVPTTISSGEQLVSLLKRVLEYLK